MDTTGWNAVKDQLEMAVRTLEWPVKVWEDPLPAPATRLDRPAVPDTRTESPTGEARKDASRRGGIRVSPWLTQANPQASRGNYNQMNGSPDQPIIIKDDPTRSDYRTWPTIDLIDEDQDPEGRTAQVREYVRIRHDVEYRDTRTGETITDPKRLERLRQKYEGQDPYIPIPRKKDETIPKNTAKDLPPGSSLLKGGANRLPLSTQLQNVVDQMKVDEKTAEDSGVPLSVQLQGVFEQMKAEEATDKENSNPERSRWSHTDPNVSRPPGQPEIAAQFQTAMDLLTATQLQTAIDQLTSEVADREGRPRNLSMIPTGTDSSTTTATQGPQDVTDPVIPAIADNEYVEPDEVKVEFGTGSDTTEELNMDDLLDNISELPLDPLPGHDILGQLQVDQDVPDKASSKESSDDDYSDWPVIRPLQIDLGTPVRQEGPQPRGCGRPRKSRRVEEAGTEQRMSEPPATRSTERGQTRSRSTPRRGQIRSRSPKQGTEDELKLTGHDRRDEKEEEEDQQQMEVEEDLKYAVAQAKERELNLDKVERAQQRLRENNQRKKNWAAQRQLDLNEQEDSATGQELLTKNNGPQGNLSDSRPKVLAPETPQDGSNPAGIQVRILDGPIGTAGWIGRTGRHGLTTKTGPPIWRKPDPDVLPIKAREKTGTIRGGDMIPVTGHPPQNPTDTGRPRRTTSGVEVGMPEEEICMDRSEKKNTGDTPLLIFSTMEGEMNKLLDDTKEEVAQVSPATQYQEKAAEPKPGADDMVVQKVEDLTKRAVITGNRRTLLICDRPPTCTGSARGQHISRSWTEEEESQVRSDSYPSQGQGRIFSGKAN